MPEELSLCKGAVVVLTTSIRSPAENHGKNGGKTEKIHQHTMCKGLSSTDINTQRQETSCSSSGVLDSTLFCILLLNEFIDGCCIFFAKSQWFLFLTCFFVQSPCAGWDHKARWNGPMAFVPRLKVAFMSWLLDRLLSGCCVSGFVELFGSRVISRDTPPNLRPAESWLCSNCSVKIFWTQLEDFGSNQLPWSVSTYCPLDMHWALMRAQLWQSPEATQSLDAQKGFHMRVMSVTSGGPKVVGHGIFWRSNILWSKLINPCSRYLIRTPTNATSQVFDHRHPDFEAVHGHSLRQFLLRHGGLLPKLQARCTGSRCSPSCRL